MADINQRLAMAAAPNDMMPGPEAEAVVTVPTTTNLVATADTKKSAVSAAADSIKARMATPYEMAAGADTQSGTQNMSDYESDMRYMDSSNLTEKYGSQARNMLLARAGGNFEYQADASQPTRLLSDQTFDTLSTGVNALANVFGGIAGFGAGLVDKDAGTAIATGMNDLTQWTQDQQSPTLQAQRKIAAAKNQLDFRDTEIQYDKEIARGDEPLMADLRRAGREAIVAVDNATDSPTMLAEGTANALGSFLAVGPLAKGIAALGKALVPAATRRGVGLAAAMDAATGTSSAARVLAGAAESAPVLTAIGLMEGGGAYNQVTADIMGRDHSQLMQESPEYSRLVAGGMDPTEAKKQIANKTGLIAASITTPLAAATGTLVSKFEGSPFAAKSLSQVVGNILKEPIEEGIQGGISQVAQNYAEQATGANPDKALSEGVGQQVGEGALYGLGMTAVLQAPQGAKKLAEAASPYAKLAALASAQAAAKKVGGSLQARADALNAANEAASPIADDTILKAATDIQETAPVAEETLRTEIAALPAEAQPAASEYVDRLMSAFNYDPSEVTADAAPALEGSTSRLQAIQKLAGQVIANEEGTDAQLSAGYNMYRLLTKYMDVAYSDKAGLEGLAPDSPATKILGDYDALMGAIQNTPKVKKALEFIQEQVEANPPKIDTVDTTTEEGQAAIANAITAAEVAPDKADLATTEKILFQISQGNVQVSPRQKAALDGSVALLRAAQAARQKAETLGDHLTEAAKVSHEVLTETGGQRDSAVSFAKRIMQAYKAGNLDVAGDTLAHMGEFAQHMSNKVGAINSHLALADPKAKAVTYSALMPNRKWKTSQKGLSTDPTNEGKVKFAQTVALEASVLADVYNGLVAAFPDLGGKHIEVTPLDSKLDVPVKQVVAATPAPAPTAESSPAKAPAPTAPVKVETPAPVKKSDDYKPKAVVMDSPKLNVWAGTGENASLSNLANRPFKDTEGREYQSVEHAYQSLKSGSFDAETYAKYKPGSQRKIAGNKGTKTTDGWNLRLMDKLIQASFEQNPEAAAALAATGEAEFTHTQDRGIWAKEFPRSLTKARTKLAKPAPVVVEPVVAEPVKTGLAAVYPELATPTFSEAFKLGKERLTFTLGSEAPVQMLSKAFRSQSALVAHVGELKHELTPAMVKDYRAYLDTALDLTDTMQANLTEFLDENDLGNRFMAGEEVNRFIAGKALNITEVVNGEVVYNPELVEMAALAGLQWHLTAGNFTAHIDDSDAASILGIPVADVTPSMIIALEAGQSVPEAKRALAAKIIEYWGVKPNTNQPIGLYTGIAESVAAELMRAMVANGQITVSTVYTSDTGDVTFDVKPEGKKVKEFDMIIPTPFDKKSELLNFPTAIEQAVLTTPTEVSYIGEGTKIPVPQTQMRQPLVDNTEQQKEALANEQETPHFVQTRMAGLFMAMGSRTLVDLFGAGQLDTEQMNKHHARSAEGANRGITSAFNRMEELLGEVTNMSGKAGVPLDQMPIFYGYNVSKVGRMHMLGQFNPQTSKLMREVILPTRDTLDLSDKTGQHYTNFMLGVGQALGLKVHKQDPQVTVQKAEAMLAGELSETVANLRDWQRDFDEKSILSTKYEMDPSTIATLKANFKGRVTPVALHAVMEYARLQDTDGKDFETSVYLEADGMTNGVVNAMALFSIGSFTSGWVSNMRRGGWFPGQAGMTANEFYSDQSNSDIYEVTKDNLIARVRELQDGLAETDPAREQMTHLLTMMDMFLPDLDYTNDLLELNRSITKNPLMISVYGSGANGIAAKMVGAMIDSIYERMTQVVQAKGKATSWAEAMFGLQSASPADAQAKLAKFSDALNALTDYKVYTNKAGQIVRTMNADSKKVKLDPKSLTFSRNDVANMRSNMLELFVKPMRESIKDVVGPSVEVSTGLLRDATQAQSIFLKVAFESEVKKALAEKAKDPSWKKGDFLTQGELTTIYKSLDHMSPMIKTGTQTFFIAGKESNDMKLTQFGRAFNGDFRSPASVYGPGNAGVSGIATLNIGAGDGQMMQTAATMPNKPKGTLKIFDGMHMRLSHIQEDSTKINSAVWDSWMRNPLADVSTSFSKFMADGDLTITQEHMELLMPALFPAIKKAEYKLDTHGPLISEKLAVINRNLKIASLQIQARHNVMARVQSSTDQMAGAASPFQVEGVELTSTDAEAIAAELNVMYQEEYTKLKSDLPTSDVGSEIKALGTTHSSGAVVLGSAGLESLSTAIKLPADQQAILEQIVKSLAADEFTIVLGNEVEVAKYQQEIGFSAPETNPGDVVKGYTSFGSRTIYLLNPSSETLAHELVHAATFQNIQNYYTDSVGTSGRDRMVEGAVKRIEVLMDQFLTLDTALIQVSPELQTTYDNVSAVIQGYLATGNAQDKAAALNEFMAWTLTNNSLQRLAKRTTASKLVQMAEAVIAAIKSMFFRNRTAPTTGTDMFSNLVFNSAILMQKPRTTGDKFNSSVLYQNSRYGNDERLAQVGLAYSQNIARYLGQAPAPGVLSANASVLVAITQAAEVADKFQSHGFNMTAQEADAFSHIVAALATEAHLDANVMLAAQDMYAHVVKSLDDKSFLADKTSTDATELLVSRAKFNVLLGKFGTESDTVGRSSLMPSFLALATVNDEFRAILEGMDLPKSAKMTDQTLDVMAENVGNSIMDRLSARMSGTTKARNVQQAIDALNTKVADLVQKRETFIDQVAEKSGGMLDRVNGAVVEGMGQLSKTIMVKSERVRKNATNRITRLAAGAVSGLSAVLSEEVAKDLGKETLAWANAANMPKPVFDLINDLVGRTQSNADVYDMIKVTKTLVQQARQQFREDLPVIIAKKFSRTLTNGEWNSLYKGMGKTDMASLLNSFSSNQVFELVTDNTKLKAEIQRREGLLRTADRASFLLVQEKAQQLAHFLNTGEAGNNLLRNASAVAGLLGQARPAGFATKGNDYIELVDELVTMYAMDDTLPGDRAELAALITGESDGMAFALSYMQAQRAEEMSKVAGNAQYNAYKGYIPEAGREGTSLVVVDDTNYAELIGKSYVRIGDYAGSKLDTAKPSMGYYFAPTSARAAFQQGIMQNVRQTAQGVDVMTGYSNAPTAGRITDPAEVKRVRRLIAHERFVEPLMPVFDDAGEVVAYERSIAPAMLERALEPGHLANSIGVWRGRQFEEGMSQLVNNSLVSKLKSMYDADIAESPSNKAQYVNLFDRKLDAVTKDAVSMMNPETRALIESTFGSEFMVRRDLLNDTVGYRAATIGDAWTGNTRWSPETQKAARNVAIAVFGNGAYKTLVNAEQTLKNVVSDARLLIAIKSVVVPMVNLISNVLQLSARGVPLKNVVTGMPKKTAELESFVRGRLRQIELEAELRAETNPLKTSKFAAELQSIKDNNRRLSIWPLLEAGEFSSVSDAGLTRSEMMLTNGRLQAFMEAAVNKLPGPIATAGRYALVTRDTALFKALQKSVEYGDFLAKSIMFDDLTQRKGMNQKEALGKITEEFVNYDRLTGRFRGALESMGLLWFYNFKIRSTKIALSMLRNNPVNALLAMSAPTILSPLNTFGSPGLPIQDNLLSKIVSGSLDYSMGPGQGLASPNLNPWYNLMH